MIKKLLFSALLATKAFATPSVDFMGDSVAQGVAGIGYHQTIAQAYPKLDIYVEAVPGIGTVRFLDKLTHNEFPQAFTSNIVLIDLGRNDFLYGLTPANSARNVRRIVSYIKSKNPQAYVSASVLIICTRTKESNWVRHFNRDIKKLASKTFKVDVRYDRFGPEILSYDGLHPSPYGFEVLGNYLVHFLEHFIPTPLK